MNRKHLIFKIYSDFSDFISTARSKGLTNIEGKQITLGIDISWSRHIQDYIQEQISLGVDISRSGYLQEQISLGVDISKNRYLQEQIYLGVDISLSRYLLVQMSLGWQIEVPEKCKKLGDCNFSKTIALNLVNAIFFN